MPTTENNEDRKKLYAKLFAVQQDAAPLKKNGYNKFQNYKYVQDEDVVMAARALFLEHKLLVVPSVVSRATTKMSGYSKDGTVLKESVLTEITVSMRVADIETGYSEEFQFTGDGYDSTDKAPYKAMTGARKYALMSLMLIPTTDDPEKWGDNGHTEESGPKQNKPVHPEDTDRGKIITEVNRIETELSQGNMSKRRNSRKKYGAKDADGKPTDDFTNATTDSLAEYLTVLQKKEAESGQ